MATIYGYIPSASEFYSTIRNLILGIFLQAIVFHLIILVIVLLIINLRKKGRNDPPPQSFGQYYNPPYGQPYQQMGVPCPHCGAMNPYGSNFCSVCGDKIN